MPEYKVTVSEDDDKLLKTLAARKWREPDKQLCAVIEDHFVALRRVGKASGKTDKQTHGPRAVAA